MEGVSLMLHNLENKLMESSMELSDFLKSKSAIIHRFLTEISSLQFDADYACVPDNALAAVANFLGETKNNWLISNREISLVKKDLAGNVTNVEVIDITENLVYTLTFKTTELFCSDNNQYCIDNIYVGKVDDTKSKEAFTHFNLLLAHYVASTLGRNQSAIISLETDYTFNLSFTENLSSLRSGVFKHSTFLLLSFLLITLANLTIASLKQISLLQLRLTTYLANLHPYISSIWRIYISPSEIFQLCII